MLFYLFSQYIMSRVILCYYQQTACIPVYPMYYAGPYYAVYSRQAVAAMIHKCIDKRSAVMPRCRMNYHSLRLIDYKQVIILINYIKRYVFGEYVCRLSFGDIKRNKVARFQLLILCGSFPVYKTAALLNKSGGC